MIIAVNAHFSNSFFYHNNQFFIVDFVDFISTKYPQHQFIFITDAENVQFENKNISIIKTHPQINNRIQAWYWLTFKLLQIVKKSNAHYLLNFGNGLLHSKIPQILFITNLFFLEQDNKIQQKWQNFYQKYTLPFLQKSTFVFVINNHLKNAIEKKYNIKAKNIISINYGVNKNYKPINYKQSQSVKLKYTNGKEFFLYIGKITSHYNLINLLKAFSIFKKRQKSNMQLVLIATNELTEKILIENFSTYKYKEDVIILENINVQEKIQITASAYALVQPSIYLGYDNSVIAAMQVGVPVLASNTAALPEICGNAALYFNPLNNIEMADNLMLLFKDENLRNSLIEKGLNYSKKYFWDFNLEKYFNA